MAAYSTLVHLGCGLVLVVIGNVISIPDSKAALTAAVISQYVAVGIAIGIPLALSRRTRLLHGRRHSQAAIRLLLESLGTAYKANNPDLHIRANVMIHNGRKGTRRVDDQTAFNMDGAEDTDHDLELPFESGVSGFAAVHRLVDAIVVDLKRKAEPGEVVSPIPEKKRAVVRKSLKSIMSVSILDPHDEQGAPILGTLQIDSDNGLEELGWNKGRHVFLPADRAAKVLAYLLKVGDEDA